jgi:hypothetical protein
MTLGFFYGNHDIEKKYANNSRLEKKMKQIRQEGNLDVVVAVLYNVDRTLAGKYKKNWLNWVIYPLPSSMLKILKENLNSNSISQDLVDYLDWDDLAFPLTFGIYVASWLGLLLFLISLLWGNPWFCICTFLLGIFLWWLRYDPFNYAIDSIGFIPLYNSISAALKKQQEDQESFIKNITTAYNNLQNSKLNAETQRLIKEAQLENEQEYRKKEIESQLALQGIASALAIAQAEDNAQVEKIKKGSELDLLAYELRIRDQGPEKERWHQLALAEIHKAEAVEVAKAKILGEESEKNRDLLREIQRNLAILSGLKTSIDRNGSGAKADPIFNEGVQELVDRKFTFDSTQP